MPLRTVKWLCLSDFSIRDQAEKDGPKGHASTDVNVRLEGNICTISRKLNQHKYVGSYYVYKRYGADVGGNNWPAGYFIGPILDGNGEPVLETQNLTTDTGTEVYTTTPSFGWVRFQITWPTGPNRELQKNGFWLDKGGLRCDVGMVHLPETGSPQHAFRVKGPNGKPITNVTLELFERNTEAHSEKGVPVQSFASITSGKSPEGFGDWEPGYCKTPPMHDGEYLMIVNYKGRRWETSVEIRDEGDVGTLQVFPDHFEFERGR